MKYLMLIISLLMSQTAHAIPKCAEPYVRARHDAERAELSHAVRTAHKLVDGVPLNLIWAVGMVESGLNQRAVSPVGAVGVMQVMHGAEQHVHMLVQRGEVRPFRSGNKAIMSRYIMSSNIWIGVSYLQFCLRTAGSIEGALIMYNGGYRQLNRWLRGESIAGETAQYVLKVLNLYDNCGTA